MVHESLALQLEQQLLDCETEITAMKDEIQSLFQAQYDLSLGSDSYNKLSQRIHSKFRTIEENHLKIARYYRKLEKMEIRKYA